MAEEPTVPQSETPAPATPPAGISQDEIRQMVEAEAQRVVDARMPGFQSAYEKQIAKLRKDLEAAKRDPDGYSADSGDEFRQELEQARREAAALRAGRQFPDAFPVYEAMMSAETVEDQLQLLQEFVRGTAPTAPVEQGNAQQPQPEPPAPIDQNNPPSTPPPAGGPSSPEAAWSIIDQFKQWPKF